MKQHIFALDIGTQSVTGILLEKNNDNYNVIDFCVRKHKERSMLDGQIQNVLQVAEIITEVKNELEKTHGPLKEVSVAAAGRALKTIRAETVTDISERPIRNTEDIKHLELSAVQQAQRLLTEDSSHYTHYHCVGYSVIHYKLDDEVIGSFIDQIGNEATVEIIATFLPRIVVESLLAALGRANLKMAALTLEPIAAIHVLIPESMRRLNVALVDIGAGTSDIAITEHGTVTAYGMVPVAGDEITEAISDEYLLDFKVAEDTKRSIVNDKVATVQDILGIDVELTYDELLPKVIERVDHTATKIAEEIIDLNGKSPQAVMLIGGGSLTPEIDEKIADKLDLPLSRVVVRGIDAIQQLDNIEKLPSGPDFVTPIGIAISANQSPLHYISVSVNNKATLMFETKQLTVGDCLIQAGIEIKKYYGKPGLASIVTINGEDVTIRGEFGKPPNIYLNDQRTTVDELIASNDEIIIEKGEDGKRIDVTIEEIVGKSEPITFIFNDEIHRLEPTYRVNYENSDKHYIVQDKDVIEVHTPRTIQDFIDTGIVEPFKETGPFFVYVNRNKTALNRGSTRVTLNNILVDTSHEIKENDHLRIQHAENITVGKLLAYLEMNYLYTIKVIFNGRPVHLKKRQLTVKRQDELLDENSVLSKGDHLTISQHKLQPFIFQDIFRFVDIEMSSIQGNYKLYCNEEEIAFPEPINDGDILDIVWE